MTQEDDSGAAVEPIVDAAEPAPIESASITLKHASGLSGLVGGLVANPSDPDQLIYAAGSTVVISSQSNPADQRFLRGHDSDITCMAVSASGRYVATGQHGRNSDVCLWDTMAPNAEALLCRLSEHDVGVACLAFSPDERLLVSVGVDLDNKLFAWDVQTGNIVASGETAQKESATTLHIKVTRAIAWGAIDGAAYTFAVVGSGKIVVWHLDASRGFIQGAVCEMGRKKREFTAAAFTEDGSKLYAGSTTGDVTSFAVPGNVLRDVAQVCAGGVNALLPLGKDFLVGGGDGTVCVFSPDTPPTVLRKSVPMCHLAGGVTSVSYGSDSSIVVGTAHGLKYSVPMHGGSPTLLEESHTAAVAKVSFRGDSTSLVSASADGSLRVWSTDNGLRVGVKALCKNVGGATCVSFTQSELITGWGDGQVRCHDLNSGELLWVLPNAHRDGVTAIAVAKGEHFFVSGGEHGEVRVWDIRTRQMISHLKEHTSRVASLLVLDDDQHVLSASKDKSMITWDLIRERRVSSHLSRVGGISAAVAQQFPDQVQVVTMGQDRTLTFWDLREPQPLQVVPQAHAQECTAAALSPNGLLATGSADQTIKLWDFETGRLLHVEHGHCKAVTSLAFDASGSVLASGGADGIIFAWSVELA